MADDETLRFYAEHAAAYANRQRGAPDPELAAFMAALPPGAAILELGTGGGHDAAAMLARGFAVTPTDASPDLAREAGKRLGIPVRLMRFSELDAVQGYDAVWANAALLHAPRDELTDDLARIHRALRPGGLFQASFKAGSGEGRDQFGRYYNYPDRTVLEDHFTSAAPWSLLEFTEADGSGYDHMPTRWLWVRARKSA